MQDQLTPDPMWRAGKTGVQGLSKAAVLQCTDGVRSRCQRIYGTPLLPVVYFIQRNPFGPVKIGYANRITDRVGKLLCDSPDAVNVAAVVPGNKTLEAWFHRRHEESRVRGEWFEDYATVIADARRFGEIHAVAYGCTDQFNMAMMAAVMQMDESIRDFYRMHKNGATIRQISELTGVPRGMLISRLESLRRMGFDLPYRNVWAPRGRGNEERWGHGKYLM